MRRMVQPGDDPRPTGRGPGGFPRAWALDSAEAALLTASAVVFVLGTVVNLAEPVTAVIEPWQLDELLLAMPLVALTLVLVLRRRGRAWQQQEARYQALVEKVPAVLYLLGGNEHTAGLYFSPYLTELTGYTPEEALAQSKRWLAWVHPGDRERVAALDAAAIAAGVPFRAEYRHQRKDGGYVWVLEECLPIHAATGDIIGWRGVVLDITDRVEAEEVRARLAAIVDSAEDAIFSSSPSGAITSWNRSAERLFGYPSSEALGQSYTMLLSDDPNDPTSERRHAALDGESVPPFETTRRRRDGTVFTASIALSPIWDRNGQIAGISSINRDITARQQMQAELRAALVAAETANQAMSQFLAVMSHELRTPLQAVLGYTEFLLADPAGTFTAEQRTDLGYIQRGGQRMLNLIDQLLDLTRLEAGRLDIARGPVDLAEIFEHVRQDVAPQASKKDLDVRIMLEEGLPPVLGDAERLHQVLLNLVGNAVKFTAQGSVEVVAEVGGANEIVIRVHDTGIGIAPEAQQHIFEMFRQGDRGLARRHGGAGLGLAIAQKLTELMGGRITVESTPGQGSTFIVQLPASTPPQADPLAGAASSSLLTR